MISVKGNSPAAMSNVDNKDDAAVPINYQLPSGYQLTWPIWHRLPNDDKVRIARLYNLSVGEFEERVALQSAMQHTADTADTGLEEIESTSRSDDLPAVEAASASSSVSTDLLEKHKDKLVAALAI